jgi:integrase
VIDACPDTQWRLIIMLCRIGGLRYPSELLPLTWGDVDWENNRLTVHSPKTEHHAGGESRVIPIFPELLPHLEEACDPATPRL